MKKTLLIALFCSALNFTFSQDNFYNIDTIREVKIYFVPNWDHILDSLYVAGQKERLLATILIDGVQYDSVGIRYKGYSSVSTNRTKNPFNIKLDYVISSQNHQGIDKLKLSNVIQDPSFVREVLTYEIARKYMPSSGANFVNLYINDTLWGLYTNVEAVNKEFVSKYYYARDNAFFKCNPDNLNLNGENSNLNNSYGTDSSNYYSYYDLESDFGWTELYNFIDTLNNFPDSIHKLLNVDRTLWMHALNYSLVNFDSYIGYAQNYYLYKDNNDRFNPILWDLNMSFASFRFTDASLFYGGFTIQNAKTLDPLTHYNNISVYPRPLLRNLFSNPRYRKMYLAHIKTIIKENIINQDYSQRALYMQNLIDTCVQNDLNKFYTYQDFQNNLTTTVSDLIDYPGITELMDARASYLNSYPGVQYSPSIDSIHHYPINYNIGDDIWIRANIDSATYVMLAYRFAESELFTKIQMLDDGNSNDSLANDGIYAAKIDNIGNSLQYYIYADNDSSGVFSPARAAYEYYTLQTPISFGDLVINEIMATNTSIVADQNGEYDDWIELYNNSNSNISTAGLYLSDDTTDLIKWPLPDVVINPDNYLIIWADEDNTQDGLHSNFRLSSSGECLYLSYSDSLIIDSLIYPSQSVDVAYARIPNGVGAFTYSLPSFSYNNNFADINSIKINADIICYPNPVTDNLYIKAALNSKYFVELIDINGRIISTKHYYSDAVIRADYLKPGLYLLKITDDNFTITKKIIKK